MKTSRTSKTANGKREALDDFMKEQEVVFEKVLNTLESKKRNWQDYLARLRTTHTKVCRDWLDDYFGQKLDQGLDQEFTYEKVLATKKTLTTV